MNPFKKKHFVCEECRVLFKPDFPIPSLIEYRELKERFCPEHVLPKIQINTRIKKIINWINSYSEASKIVEPIMERFYRQREKSVYENHKQIEELLKMQGVIKFRGKDF